MISLNIALDTLTIDQLDNMQLSVLISFPISRSNTIVQTPQKRKITSPKTSSDLPCSSSLFVRNAWLPIITRCNQKIGKYE